MNRKPYGIKTWLVKYSPVPVETGVRVSTVVYGWNSRQAIKLAAKRAANLHFGFYSPTIREVRLGQ